MITVTEEIVTVQNQNSYEQKFNKVHLRCSDSCWKHYSGEGIFACCPWCFQPLMAENVPRGTFCSSIDEGIYE